MVAGAVITITNPANGFNRTIKTDGQGNYQFLELPPAKYELVVDARGFAVLKQSGLELQVASPVTLNINLQVTGGTVTVDVSGSAPLVNTQDASLGHAFGAEQIADLPFEGRDPAGILSLQSGVVFTGNSTHIASAADSRSGAVNGARSDQTNITLDGIDNNDQLLGTAFTGAIRAPLDSLEELKVTTSKFGRRLRTLVRWTGIGGDQERHQSLSRFHVHLQPPLTLPRPTTGSIKPRRYSRASRIPLRFYCATLSERM